MLEKENLIQQINLLQTGSLKIIGQVLHGSNYTFLTEVGSKDTSVIQAIYKPDQGERPLWDFPRFTLAKREVAAFIVSRLLNWEFVPPTIYRKDGPYGSGSLQLFIPHDPNLNFFTFSSIPTANYHKIVLFDFIINNADRKGGHLIQDENGKIWLIDHGLSFNSEYKLRTVIWDFAGEKIPDTLIKDLVRFNQKLKSKSNKLLIKLKMLLNDEELDSLGNRTALLIQSAHFPDPDQDRRSYPWPIV